MTATFYGVIMGTVISISFLISLIVSRHIIKNEFSPSAIKIDISIEKMTDLENEISSFFATNNIIPGASIQIIAEKLSIEKGDVIKGQEDQAYLNKPNGSGKMVVTFTDGLTQEEMTFAFAHECAHQLNHDEVPIGRPVGRGKPEIEQFADYTAAALLMPIDDVYSRLIESNYKGISTRKKAAFIKKLCKVYHVSEIIVIRRIREVYSVKEYNVARKQIH